MNHRNATAGAGSASITATNNSATVEYTADSTDRGDTITIEVTGIDASSPPADGTYTAEFTGADDKTLSDDFTVG